MDLEVPAFAIGLFGGGVGGFSQLVIKRIAAVKIKIN
jgi:hypothetical protein